MRRRKANVRTSELHKLLCDAGFEFREGKGDHWVYRYPATGRRVTVDPRKPSVLPVYVTQALKAIRQEVLS